MKINRKYKYSLLLAKEISRKEIGYLSHMILVTGGTGFVGSHLLWELLWLQPKKIKAIYRSEAKIEAVRSLFNYKASQYNTQESAETLFSYIEWVPCDVNDIPKLTEVFTGITKVCHCAAIISFDPGRYDELHKVNVEGTANMVNLSLANDVQKFCMISSIAALGETVDGSLITEETEWDPNKDNSVYSISKFASEMEVWRGTQEGLTAVLVNPGVIMGEGFYKDGTGAFYRKIDGSLKYATPGSTGFVDVTDVAKAMHLLMKSDRVNENFILVSENEKIENVFNTIAKVLGKTQKMKLVKPWQINIAWKIDWFLSLFGKRQKLFKSMAKSAVSETRYNGSKIKTIEGFEYTPLEETLTRTGEHFKRYYKNSKE